jgi:DUF3096 family protein
MRARLLQVCALAGPGRPGRRPLLRVAMATAIVAGLAAAMLLIAANPAAAATPDFTLRVTSLSPLVALIAGILILVMPSLLNYIVALYLILIGLLGFFGR